MGVTLDTMGRLQRLMSSYPTSIVIDYAPDEETFFVKISGEAGLQGEGIGSAATLVTAIKRALDEIDRQLDAEYGVGGKRGA